MEFKQVILNRRSIRKFKNDLVPKDIILSLVEAGYNAPSACNKKPFRIYVITNKEIKEKVRLSGLFTRMISPLIIVVAGDLKKALPKDLKEYWIQDASAVTENILLCATSLGLGTCWNGVYPQKIVMEKVQKALSLEEYIIPLSIIHVGYPDEEKKPNSGFDEKKVFFIE